MTDTDRPAPERFLYRIATRADWQAAQACGAYRGAAHDARDGFIHLSRRAQVDGTLNAHYPDRTGLVLLEIEALAIAADLRFEPSRKGELFPHLYGVLPIAAIRRALTIPLHGPAFGEETP